MGFIISNRIAIYIVSLLFIVFLSISYRFYLLENIASQDISSVREGDTIRYEAQALQFLEHGTFAIDPLDVNTDTIHTQPGYSLFIALNYYFFGVDELQLLKTQILVSALTILILAYAAYLLWGRKSAIITACLMAIDPLQTLYSQVMLTETLQFFFISLMIVFAILLFNNKSHEKNHLWAFLLGLIIALSAYVHASTYYLAVPIVLGMVIFKGYLSWSKKRLAKVIIFFMIPVIILFSAWHIRNGLLTGVYEFSDNAMSTLLDWKASSVYVQRDGLNIEEAVEKANNQLPENLTSLKERYDAERELAIDLIKNNLGDFIHYSIKQYVSVLFGVGFDTFAKHYDSEHEGALISGVSHDANPIIRSVENMTGKQFWYVSIMSYSLLFLGACYLFMFIGFYHAMRSSSNEYKVIHLFLLGLAAYYILLSTGHVDSYHRYRLASMIVILLYSANGIRVVMRYIATAKLGYRRSEQPHPLHYS